MRGVRWPACPAAEALPWRPMRRGRVVYSARNGGLVPGGGQFAALAQARRGSAAATARTFLNGRGKMTKLGRPMSRGLKGLPTERRHFGTKNGIKEVIVNPLKIPLHHRQAVGGGCRTNGTSRHIQHSPNTPTTGFRERGNDTGRSTGRSGRQNAATRRNMRREERVTVQGPVKEQQPDGMSHRGAPSPLQGAQPMPSHCPPNGKRQLQWHLQPTVTAPNRLGNLLQPPV